MFSKISRYGKLPDVVTLDDEGRRLKSKALRLPPEVSGTFRHTVEEVDRLDHLAYKYYKQPRKWWRICDANPGFAERSVPPSPQALLGKEPIITERFPLTFADEGEQPPWAELLRQLPEIMGVEDVQVVEEAQLVLETQTVGDEEVLVYVEHYEWAVVVTYNQMNVGPAELADAISAAGFEVGQPAAIGRVGKQIIIPPDSVG